MALTLHPPAGMGSGDLIPLLETVPRVPWASEESAQHGIFGFNSRDIKSRSFNLLRSRILKLMEANRWRSLGVVSATPGAGKSFISSNLASAISRSPSKEVYLFDFDLRRSSIAGIFNLPPGNTLNQFLAGEIPTLRTVGRRIGEEKLVIFPSQPGKDSSSELLSAATMERLIESVRKLPEQIICIGDLPPVFANDDAAIVAAKLDAYIFVIEEGRTTKKQIRDAMNILAPAICAGTVLNRYYRGLISDDYGYGYGHGGNYGDYYS